MPSQQLVVHADWSTDPRRRAVCRAIRHDGAWRITAPAPATDPAAWFAALQLAADEGASVLLGLDLPVGLPRAYAERAGIASFPAFLTGLPTDALFLQVADHPDDIALGRPFYPRRPGGARRDFLVKGLGVPFFQDLFRRCDRRTVLRADACAMFWTLGPQQCGRAAIAAWRELLIPALNKAGPIVVWPFSGPLHELRRPGNLVVAETYPAEVYGWLGVRFSGGSGGKRSRAGRLAQAPALLEAVRRVGAILDPPLAASLASGFGPRPDGENAFDAFCGVLGMLMVVEGLRPDGVPDDEEVRRVEGWMLGLAP